MERHYPVCWLLVLLCLLPLRSATAQEGMLTVATYNVENMFDVFDDPYHDDETMQPKSRREIEQIAQAIKATDADVVVFQELEKEGLLKAVVNDLIPEQGYTDIAVMPTNSGRGINLGVVSRLPIVEMRSHRFRPLDGAGGPNRFARDVFTVTVRTEVDKEVEIFIVHLKSRRDGPNDPNSINWRSSEARTLRHLISDRLAANPDAKLLAMGDFNANPDEDAMPILLAPNESGEAMLFDTHAGLSTEQRITFPSRDYPNSILDHILASPAMAARLVPGSAKVIRDPAVTGGSDHLPVVATFDMR